MKFGYARVSSNTQDHAAQVEALKAAGCQRIFSEKASGKSTNGRPEFAKLMKALNHGDVVTVVKLDRLARSSRDLQNILHELQEMGCGFVSLGESWCDTTTDVGRLVMTIMGGIAEFERNLIRKRCEEGIQRAKRKGTKFGRPTAVAVATGLDARLQPSLAPSTICRMVTLMSPPSSPVCACGGLPQPRSSSALAADTRAAAGAALEPQMPVSVRMDRSV
jgi:DNA invertase Pin-like site-specific DNA recombinase